MCGLLGIFTDKPAGFFKSDIDAFYGSLLITSLRGKDSTGLFGVSKENDVSWLKCVGNPYAFQEWHEADHFNREFFQSFHAVVGHCRYATVGGVSVKTAHPFQKDHITLVHNGTLTNFWTLKGQYGGDVDSEMICNMIAEIGIDETLKQIEGAYALMYYDAKEQTMNVIRNSQRTLYVAFSDEKQTAWVASESATIEWMSKRYNTKLQVEPRYFEEEKLYTFPLGTLSAYSSRKIEIPTKKKTSSYYHTPHVPYNDGGWENDADFPAAFPKEVHDIADGRPFDLNQSYKIGEEVDIEFWDAPMEINHKFVTIFGRPFGDPECPIRVVTKLTRQEWESVKKNPEVAKNLGLIETTKNPTWQDEAIVALTATPSITTKIVGFRFLGEPKDYFDVFVKPI